MKKRIFAVAVVMICISILASVTWAYFVDARTARNVITMGGVHIEIVEQQEENGVLKPYPADPIDIMPGSTASKIVSVIGHDQPAWVRANYTVTVRDAQGRIFDLSAEEMDKILQVQSGSAKWSYKEGWWYYSEALTAGKTTESLFNQVTFSGPEMGNEYQNCTIVINVNAQAVQKANNGTSALTAAGWPAA